MTSLEAAVIKRMLEDPQLAPTRRTVDPSLSLVVEERSMTGAGFITSFVQNTAGQLFGDGVSMRWGETLGRLNAKVDVDFVMYVDDGFLTGLEGVTFGGEPWPSVVTDFELMEMPD